MFEVSSSSHKLGACTGARHNIKLTNHRIQKKKFPANVNQFANTQRCQRLSRQVCQCSNGPAQHSLDNPPYVTHNWTWRGHNIKYSVAGCGKPVLMIHGFGASKFQYRYTIDAVSKTNKVYAIDLLGLGESDKAPVEYSTTLWKEQIIDFINEFIEEPVVLVGNSIGSLVSVLANSELPKEKVAGTVLFNCAGGMNNKQIAGDWRIYLFLPIFYFVDVLLGIPFIATRLFDKLRGEENVSLILKEQVYVNSDQVDIDLVKSICDPADDDGALQAFVSIITGDPGPLPMSVMDRVDGPLLLLWGDQDLLTPKNGPVGQFFQALTDSRPQTSFVELVDVGHCPHDDDPDQCHEHLLPFIEQINKN